MSVEDFLFRVLFCLRVVTRLFIDHSNATFVVSETSSIHYVVDVIEHCRFMSDRSFNTLTYFHTLTRRNTTSSHPSHKSIESNTVTNKNAFFVFHYHYLQIALPDNKKRSLQTCHLYEVQDFSMKNLYNFKT